MHVAPTLADLQAAGFPMGGTPFVALDLVDTIMLAVTPPIDLIATADDARRWWELQAPRLPDGPVPEPAATLRLRDAAREVFAAHLEGRAARAVAIDDVNAFAAAVPTSGRLVVDRDGLRGETRWHTEYGGNARLAAIAGEVVTLMSTPAHLARLRKCANAGCSMLFIAENSRRQWCTGNICGNRTRVARHYERRRAEQSAARQRSTSAGTRRRPR